jgi:hypothetical protein
MSIFLSYYDDEKNDASTSANRATTTSKKGKSSGFKKFGIALGVIFLIIVIAASFYLFILQPIQQSPIIKLLSAIPLNKSVPLATAITSIENLSSVEKPTNYNITYNINAGGSISSSGINFGTSINGTDQSFSTDNMTRFNTQINSPQILSTYFSKINYIYLKNGSTVYECIKFSGSSDSILGHINNYTCSELNSNYTYQVLNQISPYTDNLSSYLKGMNFTMTKLQMSSYNGNSCVQMSGNVNGLPSMLINKLLSMSGGQINSSDIKLLLNGSINTCISVVNYQPLYLDLKGAGTMSLNISNVNNNSTFPNHGTTSGSYGANVYLNITEISSGAPLNATQILSLPSKPIVLNSTSAISNILNNQAGSGNQGGTGLSQNQGSNYLTTCIALSGSVCSNPSWSGSNITVSIAQTSGENYTLLAIGYLNQSNLAAAFSNNPFSFPPGTSFNASQEGIYKMTDGSTYTVNLPSGISNPTIGQNINGQIWLEYTTPGISEPAYIELGILSANYR